MTKTGIILALIVVVASSLAPTAFAAFSTCGGDAATQNWASSATNFLEASP